MVTALRQMATWKVATLAFLAMCFQDVLATVMVIQESHYDWQTAGLFDAAAYIFGLACLALAFDPKDGFFNRRSATIIGAVSVANYFGTMLGVLISQALNHH